MSPAATDIRVIRFGVIGCGLMGREFASAAARWCHLLDLDFRPQIVAVCDTNADARGWFERQVPSVSLSTDDYTELLASQDVDAIYCAVPHHLHDRVYTDVLGAGKHLLGEKPFGIDAEANERINAAVAAHPELLVRCSSELPFFPGAYAVQSMVCQGRLGKIIEAECGFWHSSDLNPHKPINWKRRAATCGEYGCMGDLGMHVLHLPLRFGWRMSRVTAVLSDVVATRPDGQGGTVPCDTWDNATLFGEVEAGEGSFPLTLSTKRIAPGHANTWFVRVFGTRTSVEFSTRYPKQLLTLDYEPGGAQAWRSEDTPCVSAYPAITGPIFEFGFSDAILQMWAAFCDELVNRDRLRQPFHCVTPAEAAQSHALFTAALRSHATKDAVAISWPDVRYGLR